MCVATQPEPDASLEYLDPEFVLPLVLPHSEPAWSYLARTIKRDGLSKSAVDSRFVEPGVGRTYIVDFVHFADASEYLDFSVTGAGPTPYSAQGLLNIGNHEDGYVPLVRARHRHRMSQMLSSVGSRVPRTGALIILRNHHRREPDGRTSSVALLVRGFRNVLRVKQLDPIANLMISRSRWAGIQAQLRAEAEGILKRMPSPGLCRCLTPSIVLGSYRAPSCSSRRTCNVLRRYHIRSAAPALIFDARERLAFEIFGEPIAAALPPRQYVQWFSQMLGAQLGFFRALRMLHDYRVTGPTQAGERFNSLSDTNVTLAAELPDLDTLMKVDDCPEYNHEVFGVTRDQERDATNRFLHHHGREVELAFGVARTLANAARQLDGDSARFLRTAFNEGYRKACGRPAW
jgi:hypothetical protein